MSKTYYEPRDLDDFPHIGEYAPEPGATARTVSMPTRTNACHWAWAATK
ncbi:MAG: hypothetical protein R6W95_06625 [Desulfosarcina sp.]